MGFSPDFDPTEYVKVSLQILTPNDHFFSPEMDIHVSAFHFHNEELAHSTIPEAHCNLMTVDQHDAVLDLLIGYHLVIQSADGTFHFHRHKNSGELETAFQETRKLYKSLTASSH